METFVSIIITLFSWLPTGETLPQAVHTGATLFGNNMYALNIILPIDELRILAPIVITYVFAKQTIRLTIWIIGIIRGSGGMIQPN